MTASEIAAAIAEAVQAFIGDETQSDDITLIVLKRDELSPTGVSHAD